MSEYLRRCSFLLATLVVASALGAFGCAQDVEDIDRTQPDKIDKSYFDDGATWYFRQTVIDTNVTGQPGYGIDNERRPYRKQSPLWTSQVSRKLKRIKWEIHENVLYARSTVEPAEGVTEQIDGEKHQELGIVAAFPIQSHFDVQRQYNTSTGEPKNVIVENRTDRPWYEREYMRVNWSYNLVTATSSVFSGQLWGVMSPKASAVSGRSIPQEEDRIDPGRTEISEDIVSATSEYVFNPDLVGCVAAVGADSEWKCEGGTATVRNFFWRVNARKERRYENPDQKHYKPMQYRDDVTLTKEDSREPLLATSGRLGGEFLQAKCTDTVNRRNRKDFGSEPSERCNEASFGLFDRFGYFRTNVAKWSEERHTYDSGRTQYANRYNIWETMYDEDGNLIPIEDRDPHPIVYHLNAGYPKEMMEMAETIEQEWDRTFKKTVAAAQDSSIDQVESDLKDGGFEEGQMFKIEKNSCHPSQLVNWKNFDDNAEKRPEDRRSPEAVFTDYIGDVAVGEAESALWDLKVKERKRLCEELEWATEERSDDSRFTWEQRGDFRYSFFSWVRELNTGWGGYGPSSADPKTGEIIAGSANYAGRILPLLGNIGADIIKYMNGEYSRETIERGLHVRNQLAGESGDGSGSDSNEEEQGLKPPMIEGPDRRKLDENVPPEGRPKIDISEYRSKLPDEPERNGKTPSEIGRSPEFIDEVAYRQIKASEEADATDGRVVDWLERPKVKNDLMSNPMMNQAVKGVAAEWGGGPEAAEDEDRVHQAYLALNAPMLLEDQMERRRRLLHKNNVFSTHSSLKMIQKLALMTGAAKRFKGEPHDKIAEFVQKKAFYGTQLHELGHTFGLRHNFSASLDAMNYHDAFWKFEKLQQAGCGDFSKGPCKDGKLTDREARRGGQALADEILGKDNHDGYVSKAEQRLASIMDYTAPPRLLGRNAGLGKYDQAAITFAYGRHIQRFKPGMDLPNDLGIDLRFADYYQTAAIFGDEGSYSAPRNACRDPDGNVEEECLERGVRRLTEGRKWISIEEAKQHTREVLNQNTRAFKKVFDEGTSVRDLPSDAQPRGNRIVPYNFCTDDRRGRSLGCDTFDWGSNHFEIVGYSIQEFQTMQPFNRYRGSDISGRPAFFRSGGLQSQWIREMLGTLSLIDTPFRYFSFYKAIDLNLGATTDDVENAAKLGLNFYGNLLTTPSPGEYCYYDETDDVDPRFNPNEKLSTPEGVFVPDDVYSRDRKLGECEKRISRIHQVEPNTRYALKLSAKKSDWSSSRSLVAEYEPATDDTRVDVAKELTSRLSADLNSRNNDGNSNNDLPSLTVRRLKSDVVLETFGRYDSYGLEKASTNRAENALSSMTSPHPISKGTGEHFSFKRTPEYHYRVDRAGTYLDKLVAGSRMFQLSSDFTFAEFATDLRSVNITYWTEFPDPLYRMLHGLFLGDYEEFGGGYSPSEGSYQRWNLLGFDKDQDGDGEDESLRGEDLIGGANPGMPTDVWAFQTPNSFTIRQRLLVFALSEFSTWRDKRTDFDEYTIVAATEQEKQNLPDKFTEVKNGETVLSSEGEDRTISFTHPVTNRTYFAVAAKEGDAADDENRSITYDLLKWAKRVKKKYKNASPTPGPREEIAPKEKYREDLENIIARINLIRQVRAYFFREG